MVVTVLIVIPMLLAELPRPKNVAVKHTMARAIFPKFARVVGTKGRSRAVLITCLVIALCATYFSSWVQIGEPEPGSPLLYHDHDFNISSTAINDRFPGAEELFIIARADENGGLKKPEIMKALTDFQNHMMLDPKLGGVKGGEQPADPGEPDDPQQRPALVRDPLHRPEHRRVAVHVHDVGADPGRVAGIYRHR